MKKEKVYSMNDKKVTTGGLGIGTILFLIFLTLKLAEVEPVVKWSWWWVTSPLWIPFAFIGAMIAIGLMIAVIVHKLKNK